MAKTYIPAAIDAAQFLHKYLTRYQARLSADITESQANALVELITCLAAFLVNWHKPTPTA